MLRTPNRQVERRRRYRTFAPRRKMAMAGNIEDIRKYPTYALVCRRYAPFETFGVAFPYGMGRFEGDNRGPSTSLKDSSRIYQVIFFNRYGLVYDYAGTSGTAYNSAVWGKIVGHAKISSTAVRGTLSGPDLFAFEASNAGGNPLVKPAPDINTLLRARIDLACRVSCVFNAKSSAIIFRIWRSS